MGSLLGIAALIAAVALGIRMLPEQYATERARPGATPAKAIAIDDYSDIDVRHPHADGCPLQAGHFIVRGEGPASHPTGLRVAEFECRKCERQQRLYFDVSTVRH